MNITVEYEEAAERVAVMRVDGELDQSNYLDVVARARDVASEGVHRLVLDLSGLTYMGSSGVFALRSIPIVLSGGEPPDPEDGWGAIHSVEGQTPDDLARVKLLAPQPQVDRVLERTGMKRYFETHTDRATAIASLF